MAQQNNNSNNTNPDNASHLPNHLQNGSAPPSPSTTNVQQGGGSASARQPASYPSPTSYPSPSMANSQQYGYPAPQQQGNEAYRASPTGSNGSLSLPSMRSLDPLQQQHGHHMGSPLPSVTPMTQQPYYQSSTHTLPHPSYSGVTSDPSGMRYALPQQDSRIMSGGRHKKEIKRRTKTGCLTCRKRRIKCDEGQPACRNCQKSKRECQGYDPVFKHAPVQASIQPAPTSASSAGGIAGANPYGSQPHLLPGTYGTGNMAYDPALTSATASQYGDYASAIDPALESAAPPTTAAGTPYHQTSPGMPSLRNELKRDIHSESPSSSGAVTPHLRGGASSPVPLSPIKSLDEDLAYTNIPGKRTVDDLLALGGPPPPASSNVDFNANPAGLEEVKHLYYSIYAPGLESFLESKWFSVKGLAKLLQGKKVLDQFAGLLAQFARTAADDIKSLQYTASVEARVIWALAGMVRTTAAEANGAKEVKTVPAPDDPNEAANRLTVFETLLTGKIATANPLTAPVPGSTDHHRLRELEFWYTLANFVTVQDSDAGSAKSIDEHLAALRNLLDGRENRDVLYSIAVVRAIGPRVSEYTENDTPLHLDESDNKSKLLVAKKFVADEAGGNGTTNVIRRLCDLATRSWTPPTIAAPAISVDSAK